MQELRRQDLALPRTGSHTSDTELLRRTWLLLHCASEGIERVSRRAMLRLCPTSGQGCQHWNGLSPIHGMVQLHRSAKAWLALRCATAAPLTGRSQGAQLIPSRAGLRLTRRLHGRSCPLHSAICPSAALSSLKLRHCRSSWRWCTSKRRQWQIGILSQALKSLQQTCWFNTQEIYTVVITINRAINNYFQACANSS